MRIIAELGRPYDIAGQAVSVGASVGIATAPADASDADALLKRADVALYRAKHGRQGGFRRFGDAADPPAEPQRVLTMELRRALRQEEFDLFYQPLIRAATREVVGFEALLRWQHPTRGCVLPDAFIPVSEESGLIVPIGAWVLTRACAQAAQWPAPLKVAVNLSAVQFQGRALVPAVTAALAASGLAPARLELEITETVLLRHTTDTLASLHALRELGIAIVMDDFGAGYSSLNYLRQFPFDKVKVDRSFVHELGHRREALAILRAITGLCRQLDIATLVEGVETEAQFAALRDEYCQEVQGFLFGAPRPAADVAAMLDAGDVGGLSEEGREKGWGAAPNPAKGKPLEP